MMVLFKKKKMTILIRIVSHVQIVRNIVPWYVFENRPGFRDLGTIIQYNTYQSFGIMVYMMMISVYEPKLMMVILSILYLIAITFGEFALYFYSVGQEKVYEHIYQNMMTKVYSLVFLKMILQYTPVCLMWYQLSETNDKINQISIAKLSLRAVTNHLNQAIIVRTEDGLIDFCNDLARRLIDNVTQKAFSC